MAHSRSLMGAFEFLFRGLEALVLVGSAHRTDQFTQRCVALAHELSIPVTEENVLDAYGPGLPLVHRVARVDLSKIVEPTPDIRHVDRLQQTLRDAIYRGLKDPAFAARFATDAMILGEWPVARR